MKMILLQYVIFGLILLPLQSFGAADDEVVQFSLSIVEIDALEVRDNVIWIKLSTSASSWLKMVTGESYGKQINVDIEGVPVLQMHIFATIESGVIQINNPKAEVRRRLERLDLPWHERHSGQSPFPMTKHVNGVSSFVLPRTGK